MPFVRRRRSAAAALAGAVLLAGTAVAGTAVAAPAIAARAASPASPANAAAPTRTTHDELMGPYLTGPTHARVTAIDLRQDRVLIVAQGRNLSTTRQVSPQEATYGDKQQMLTNRGIPLTGITVYDWTQQVSPVIKGSRYASWPELQTTIDSGGAVASEGYAHTSLDSMTPTRRWQDTCGVLGDYRDRGFDASSLYAYSGGPHQANHQQELVKYCYSFGRKYLTRLNTMLQLADPWVLNVRSINGGCVNRAATCFGTTGTKGYDTLENLRSTLVPNAGQVAVLQYYHLVVGQGPTWDCTSPQHETARTEVYCLSDVMSFLDGLPSDVKVATTADLAASVGRAPGQLPGLSLDDYLRSQPH